MRITDQSKIKRVIEETKRLVVERGYHGASIAEIAKRAGVSDGYLYRHHENKKELITYIFRVLLEEYHEHVFKLIEKYDKAQPIIEEIVAYMIDLDQNDPEAIRFTYTMIYQFDFEYPEDRAEAIDQMCIKILELGHKTGEIGKHIRVVDILVIVFTLPIKLTEFRRLGGVYYNESSTIKDEKKLLANICMNALK